MPQGVVVTVRGVETTLANRRVVAKRVRLIDEGGKLWWTFPHAPQLENRGLADDYATVARPGGRLPLLEHEAKGLRVMTASWLLGHSGGRAIDDDLRFLVAMSRNHRRVRLDYGPLEDGLWRITDLGVSSERRLPDGRITQAQVSLELTRASDLGPQPSSLAGLPRAAGRHGGPTSVVAKSSDSLRSLAKEHLGDGDRWPELAEANGVTDPRAIAGTVLRLR